MGKAGKKKAEAKGGFFDFGNLLFLAIAAGIGYCRYNQINIPILDDFLRKALYGDAAGGGGMGDEVVNSLADARAGKPIAVSDVLGQMNRYCRRGKCNDDYWEALPEVAKALKMGPGTWDRKPLKKDILVKVAEQPQARTEAVWAALRIVSKELLDVTPKSMKESLASRVALKSAKPPEGSATPEPEKEEEEIVVDDLP
ncbi:unnamed protein product [Cladocopium goreaui]|uniref:Uncharacterized protein n=1 Tax=Cladocopium goreaui TaxID=2562237 RepID=A0A9P1C6U7_9DINO|nr:unnamed protein product [Cladocopium goreaui]